MMLSRNRSPRRFDGRPFGVVSVRVSIGLACAVSIAGASALAGQESPPVAIEHVSVIPMDDERVLADVTVLVDDGRVRATGQVGQIAIPAGAILTGSTGADSFWSPGFGTCTCILRAPPRFWGCSSPRG